MLRVVEDDILVGFSPKMIQMPCASAMAAMRSMSALVSTPPVGL